MNYSQFLYMIPEAALTAALVILFVADFCSAKDGKRSWFNPLASLLLALVTVVCCYTTTAGEASAFGGMYQANAGVTVVKTILALPTKEADAHRCLDEQGLDHEGGEPRP